MRTRIGVDPGKSGAISCLDGNGDPEFSSVYKMPETERDVWNLLCSMETEDSFAFIEKVNAMPGRPQKKGDKSRTMGATSAFTFGMGYGGLRMALIAAGIPFETITPGKWQKHFGLITPKGKMLTTSEKKKTHKARAQELFPHLKVTQYNADSILLAEYCRQVKAR